MGLTCGAHPPTLGTSETNHSMRLSPSPLHELAIFEPNLPCDEFHAISFGNNSKTCDFPKRKSKMLAGGSCHCCVWGLCLHYKENDDDYCRH